MIPWTWWRQSLFTLAGWMILIPIQTALDCPRWPCFVFTTIGLQALVFAVFDMRTKP